MVLSKYDVPDVVKKALLEMLMMVMMMMTMMMPVALASELQSQLTVPNHHNFHNRPHIGQRIQHLLINLNLPLQRRLGVKMYTVQHNKATCKFPSFCNCVTDRMKYLNTMEFAPPTNC